MVINEICVVVCVGIDVWVDCVGGVGVVCISAMCPQSSRVGVVCCSTI